MLAELFVEPVSESSLKTPRTFPAFPPRAAAKAVILFMTGRDEMFWRVSVTFQCPLNLLGIALASEYLHLVPKDFQKLLETESKKSQLRVRLANYHSARFTLQSRQLPLAI